ncbi:MAG: translation initiation factor IF-3, partial [Clostridia bacterium]
MNYGKFKFEQQKKLKEAKKKQKIVEVKEIRLTLNIDNHDLETKIRHAIRFLEDGDKVKISVRFKGREMAHSKLGETLLLRVKEELSEYGVVDKPPKFEGRSIVMIVSQKAAK